MKKSYALGIVSLTSLALSMTAGADVNDRHAVSIGETDRSSTLAWSLAAYVPCNDYNEIASYVEIEVATLEATDQEAFRAMQLLLDEDFACEPLRDYASNFIQAVENRSPVRSVSGELASVQGESGADQGSVTLDGFPAEARPVVPPQRRTVDTRARRLSTPPLNSNLQTTSDY